MRTRRWRKRLPIVAVILAFVAAVGLTFAARDDDPTGVGGAVGLAEDRSRFESPSEAGDTFAVIASVLMDDARACVADHSVEHPRCVALSEGAAYVQSVAVAAATCTGPGVFDMRVRVLEHLRTIQRVGDADDAVRPPIARVPSCS